MRVKHRRIRGVGKIPTANSMIEGEIVINPDDSKAYIKTSSNQIACIGKVMENMSNDQNYIPLSSFMAKGNILVGTSNPISPFDILPIGENGYRLCSNPSMSVGLEWKLFSSNPVVSSITPSSSPAGTQVHIYGNNFGDGSSGTITFGSYVVAPINPGVIWNSSSITCNIPTQITAGTVGVRVTSAAKTSNIYYITVTSISTDPHIMSVSPSSVISGTSVTIVGSYFTTPSVITINGIPLTNLSYLSGMPPAMEITGTIPGGVVAGVGNIVLTTSSNKTSNTYPVTITATSSSPAISSLSASSGAIGTDITIIGTNFGSSQGSSVVTFNGINSGTCSVWNTNSITCTIPTGATTGNVVVNVNGINSNGVNFTVSTPVVVGPHINQIAPSSLYTGEYFTILGSGFGDTKGTSNVIISTAPNPAPDNHLSISSWSNDTIIAQAILYGTIVSGDITVVVGTDVSNAVALTILPTGSNAPHIDTMMASGGGTGEIGTTVMLIGSYFGEDRGSSVVVFPCPGGFITEYASWSNTQIAFVIPEGSVSGGMSVMSHGRQSNTYVIVIT